MAPKKKLGTAKKTTKKPNKGGFKLEISFNDTVYKGEALNLRDVLNNFIGSPVFNEIIKTPVLVDITENGETRHTTLPVGRARVLFRQAALRDSTEFLAKLIETRLR